jgi:hypothetical protein
MKYIFHQENINLSSMAIDPTTEIDYVHPIEAVGSCIQKVLGMAWYSKEKTVDALTQEAVDNADIIYQVADLDEVLKNPKYQKDETLLAKVTKNVEMLRNSNKVIDLSGVGDPHPGSKGSISDGIETRLMPIIMDIYEKASLQFPQGVERVRQVMFELDHAITLEKRMGVLRTTLTPEGYRQLKLQEYFKIFTDATYQNWMIRSNNSLLPSDLWETPPTEFTIEALNSYKHSNELFLFLSIIDPFFYGYYNSKTINDWVNKKKEEYIRRDRDYNLTVRSGKDARPLVFSEPFAFTKPSPSILRKIDTLTDCT